MAVVRGRFKTDTAASPTSWFSSSNSFATIADHNGHPIILSIGRDGVLRLFRRGPDMAWAMTDLSSLLALTEREYVTAFAASQTIDLTTFLVIAIGPRSGTAASQASSRLTVLKPFKPGDVLSFSADVMKQLILPSTKQIPSQSIVRLVRLGPHKADEPYASIIISFKPIEEIRSSADVARVLINDELTSWALRSDMRLPIKASRILDMCHGVVLEEEGVFVLHQVGSETSHLLFTAYSGEFDSSVDCPSDTTCIASILVPEGDCELLMAANGVYWVSAEELATSGSKGIQLLMNSLPRDIKTFSVVPKGLERCLTVWAIDAHNNLVVFDIPQDVHPRQAFGLVTVPNMDEFEALDSFCTDEKNLPSLLTVTTSGFAQLLEPSEKGLMYISSLLPLPTLLPSDKTEEIVTCQLMVSQSESSQGPMQGAIMRLQASEQVPALVQGVPCLLTLTGSYFGVGDDGILNLVLPKKALRLRVESVLNERGSNVLPEPAFPIKLSS